MDLANIKNNEPVDWRDDKTLQNCMMYMLEKEMMCDVTFRVGDGRKTMKAHKNILASRSEVFHTMFDGSLPEKKEINIPDIDEDSFKNLLRYVYTDVVQISNKNVTSMLYVAEKYMLTTIKTKCSQLLRFTAKSVDAVVTLSTANQFHLEDLLKESLQYIEETTGPCLLSSYATELNNDCLRMILMSDHLSFSETEVCKFFLKWIETQCHLHGKDANSESMRDIAEGLMRFIRFPLVEKTYFSNEVSHSMLLTKDEIISVYRYHHGEKCSLFSDKPRYPRIPNRYGVTHNIYRHASCNYPLHNVSKNALKFHLNRSIWLTGCIIFGPVNTNISHEQQNMFTFELTDDSENVVCWEVLKISLGTTFINTVALNLAKPVLLHADTQYTIIVHDIKLQTYYGINCKSVCIHDSVTITFANSPKSTSMTSVTQGQIAGIMYSV